jgi:hypothetical protein
VGNIKIGIVDADLLYLSRHRFPNLACMKLSGHHKAMGDETELLSDYKRIKEYDKVYISKVFTDTYVPDGILQMDTVVHGGTGFYYDRAPQLPEEVEHHMPDYSLYQAMAERQIAAGKKESAYQFYTDYSLGFLTRGCFRRCAFCVNRNSTKSESASPLAEFYDSTRKKMCFLDDNFLACPQWEPILESVLETGRRFQFRQGLDLRIMHRRQMQKFFQGKHDGNVLFAFDDIQDKEVIVRQLELLYETVPIRKKELKLYVLCGFDRTGVWQEKFWIQDIRDTLERIRILMHYGCIAYVMRYERWKQAPPPYRGMYINLARWCNQPAQYAKKSIQEFCIGQGEGSATYRYYMEFRKLHPEMEPYLNMKYGEVANGALYR